MGTRNASFEAVELELIFTQRLSAQFNQMFVVCEEEYLGSFRQTSELRKDGPGTLIVKRDQQVIENEGHRLVFLQIPIERGEPERQV